MSAMGKSAVPTKGVSEKLGEVVTILLECKEWGICVDSEWEFSL